MATGGGSRDRNIRFWHAGTGTLLSRHTTGSQVTQLLWLRYRKELVATFGFGDTVDGKRPHLLAVYGYPSMSVLSAVPGGAHLRIVGADASPDGRSVCVAANDSTIRIYNMWLELAQSLVQSQLNHTNGIYGSRLIELREGVDLAMGGVR